VFALAARAFNFRHWGASWRVTPELLRAGEVEVACSVLYRPFEELDLHQPYGAPPASAYFGKLIELMDAVEREVAATGGTIVRTAQDLEVGGPRYVHCVEGGFHLGATADEVTRNVHALADRGVAYVTLAHLFWRGVATNTPALPFLPDAVYDRLFPQADGLALSPLGEAALEAMYERRVLADISHMRQDAIDETFRRVEALDASSGRDPRAYPVIATHGVYRFGRRAYGLTDGTIARIAARGGVVGLILAQHQLKDGIRRSDTTTLDESLDLLGRHIDAIGPEHVAIGSDLDGFIKPTLGGIESAADLKTFARALAMRYPATAEQMLTGNALRVIRTRFASATT
jgi:microsomal dipeptidase-like Zn-dependent dipeptidase